MTLKEIVDGLQFTLDMFLFDPTTGETYPEPRNDMDKITIDACKGAIELLEKQPCEDCISRAEALRIAKSYYHAEYVVDRIRQLPSVTPKARWIPVSERLPEENIHVLCKFYMGGMAECYHAHDYWHIVGGFRIKIDDVLAWMPLPEGYKEEDE